MLFNAKYFLNKIFKNEKILVILISIVTYIIFYYPSFNTQKIITGTGSTDALSMHYPFRHYLFEKLVLEKSFPFWSERVHSGFPVYADLEKAFLSPINILSVILFGPYLSYKIIYFLFYLAGSLGLFYFLKSYRLGIKGWFVSNLIYYFSFFHILRLQLFNSILISFTFPLSMFFIKKYSEKHELKYLILLGILNTLNLQFGQLNYLFLSMSAQLLFLFILILNNGLVKSIKSFLLYLFIFLAFSMHALIPAYNLFKMGDRNSGSITYTEGSLSPVSALVILYPYLFGDIPNYMGKTFDNNYYLNEVYIYVGISAFLLAIFGYLKMRELRLFYFLVIISASFFIFGFIKYIPGLNNFNIPPLNLFRYWTRTAMFLLFSISVFAGYFIENAANKITLKRLLFLFIIPLFLMVIEFLNKTTHVSKILITHILHGGIKTDFNFYVWLFLGTLTVIILIFYSYPKFENIEIRKNILQLILILLVTLDIGFFSMKSITYAFKDKSKIVIAPKVYELENKRVVSTNDSYLFGNTFLYLKSWSLFGYSGPFESKQYSDYLKYLGFNSQRKTGFDINVNNPDPIILNNLKKLGVVRIYDDYFAYYDVPQDINNIDLISVDNMTSSYITKKEGYIEYRINNLSGVSKKVNTYIRNYPGWKVYIDNKKINTYDSNITSSDIYLSYLVPKGEHIIKMVYIPKDLILGSIIGIIMLVLIYPIYRLIKKDFQ